MHTVTFKLVQGEQLMHKACAAQTIFYTDNLMSTCAGLNNKDCPLAQGK